MKCDTLGFETVEDAASVPALLRQWPTMPPKVWLALAVASLLSRTVTPFRLCACGCGASVHGKARLDSAACRKRVQRQRDAGAIGSPKQFKLVLQHELPMAIPTVTVQARPGSEISAL